MRHFPAHGPRGKPNLIRSEQAWSHAWWPASGGKALKRPDRPGGRVSFSMPLARVQGREASTMIRASSFESRIVPRKCPLCDRSQH